MTDTHRGHPRPTPHAPQGAQASRPGETPQRTPQSRHDREDHVGSHNQKQARESRGSH
ncbi:hypothetical protein [uncultured Pseudacidovorax sp.]|uniref:hypothetical protein n=1 Tax=uncultured Pseudacidovorax sp. TaxID=679313 RepID=UPI0025CF3E66|nr:hypothetical protein [uncultured Pseudacidovorax sp.]